MRPTTISPTVHTIPRPAPHSQRAGHDADHVKINQAIADTLDLSLPSRNPFQIVEELRPEDQEVYLEQLARLLREGIVGTETLDVRGQPYTSFASTRFADPELAHARPAALDRYA